MKIDREYRRYWESVKRTTKKELDSMDKSFSRIVEENISWTLIVPVLIVYVMIFAFALLHR